MNPFSLDYTAQITANAVRRIRSGHLWIYSGDVEREPENVNPAFVRVLDPSGNEIGWAFYSKQSQIRLRLFTRNSEPPSIEFFRSRILASIARRQAGLDSASACRLVFGEGDLLPGIIVDRYGNYLAIQTLSNGADILKPVLIDILRDALNPQGIIQRNDVKARRLEGLEEICGIVWGEIPDDTEILEDGIRFIVNLKEGQKTGFFLDQSENRIEAKKYARGRALDCFTNTGAFALHFAQCCDSVLAIDISSDSIAMAQRNRNLNNFGNLDFTEANVFDFLRELEREGQLFDTICLDPPAFAKNRKSLSAARSGYKEINLRALKLLKPEGVLVTSSCSYHMSESEFFNLICEAARDCRRFIQTIERRGQASDHPVLIGMPETYYLKCLFLRAL